MRIKIDYHAAPPMWGGALSRRVHGPDQAPHPLCVCAAAAGGSAAGAAAAAAAARRRRPVNAVSGEGGGGNAYECGWREWDRNNAEP
jgi:hypothetical protein